MRKLQITCESKCGVTLTNNPRRSSKAREAAELALGRVILEYGQTPSFVVLGGLVPDLLCRNTSWRHAGTTDIDVQVNLEIATRSEGALRLENALLAAGFTPSKIEHLQGTGSWRWQARLEYGDKVQVQFDLLADREDIPAGEIITFLDCKYLGAANLRGTQYAALDVEERELVVTAGKVKQTISFKVTGLAGFLIAKTAAAHSRASGREKDWYDIAFVLLHNDLGGVGSAVQRVKEKFPEILNGSARTWLTELRANFVDSSSQGVEAFVSQMAADHPDVEIETLSADAILAVTQFCEEIGLN